MFTNTCKSGEQDYFYLGPTP